MKQQGKGTCDWSTQCLACVCAKPICVHMNILKYVNR